jgi:hypothetical protein
MFNEAIKYLVEKYKDQCHKVQSTEFRKKVGKCKNVREKRILYENMVDSDYEYLLPRDFKTDDKEDQKIFLLIGQYYFGIGAKRELTEIMTQKLLEKSI